MTQSTQPNRLLATLLFSLALAACGGDPETSSGKNDQQKGADSAGGLGGGVAGKDNPTDIDVGDGSACMPVTCEELAADCGRIADGCGDILDCGSCDQGALCGIQESNTCTTLKDLCQPLLEDEACEGKECGIVGDGCETTYDCGNCGGDEVCGVQQAFQCDLPDSGTVDECPAEILSCESDQAGGAECGIIGNGCGGTLDCTAELGECPTGTYCGFGGPNKCGVVTSTCQPLAAAVACAGVCGVVSNGCGVEVNGGIIDCSAHAPCPDGQVCGGAGVTNECGSGDGLCMPVAQATACAGLSCGGVSNGCDGSYSCGSCAGDEMCEAGACQPLCVPISQASACVGKSCGVVGDSCGDTYSCGSCGPGETCGLEQAFVCGDTPPPVCVPLSQATACAGNECGIVYDGCGTAAANQIACGAFGGGCGPGQYCGIAQAFQCDAPSPPTCDEATSCADLGWACGIAVDDCGNTFDCALEGRDCSAVETCVGGIDGPTQCVSEGNPGDCPLCDAVPTCSGQSLTSLSGRVVTPGRNNADTGNQVGVPNAFVYILRSNDAAVLPAFTDGVDPGGESCGRCTDETLGPVLASALTDSHGEYTITGNVPVGQQFLLVVKVGKFRRAQHFQLAAGAACSSTQLSASLPSNPTRLPRDRSDGVAVNVPHIAVSTGSADGMECVFEKLGIAHGEFTRPAFDGRIHLYRSNGAWPDQASSNCGVCTSDTCRRANCNWVTGQDEDAAQAAFLATFNDQLLYQDGGRISEYDMVVFDCQGGGWAHETASDDENVRQYVNRGGRMFASHYSRHWICDNGSTGYTPGNPYVTGLSASATFDCSTDGTTLSAGTGIVSLGRPGVNTAKLLDFAAWLENENAATLIGGRYVFDIVDPRDLATAVGAASEEFVYRETGASSTSVQQYSFTTPYAAPAEAACGRVAYSGFHVSGGSAAAIFPNHCAGSLTDQEKVLLYALFDLGGCVGNVPEPPDCTPQPCEAGTCGNLPDGCGGTQACECESGEVCNGNTCMVPGCTLTTCAAEGADCGVIADGCGGILDCGDCPVCVPVDQNTACAGLCGFVSDDCGGVYQCPIDCGDGVCNSGACTGDSCVPAPCPAQLECGYVSDGCEGVAFCGDCVAPEACGAGGEPNMCDIPVCDPLACDDLDAECGMIGDGCGQAVDCGPCPGGMFCGGYGMPNKCVGCMPTTCEAVDAECGAIGDGCGASIDCGPCPPGEYCGALAPNKCGPPGDCEPQSCVDVGAECGVIGDGCGDTVDCGPCPPGEVCGIETPFQCGPPPPCTPLTCADVGAQCGLIGDGCGDIVDCGECPNGSACGNTQPNKCSAVK